MMFDPTRQSRRLDAWEAAPGFGGASPPPGVESPGGYFLSWQPGRRPVEYANTIAAGAPNGIGPNLWGIIGNKHAHSPTFANYSEGMKAMPGVWDFDAMNAWLIKPSAYVKGTKMNFAGLSKPEDRANLIAWLNTQGSNLPLPAAPAAAAASAEPAAAPKG